MREGIKIIQPIPLDYSEKNNKLCDEKITWLHKMYYSNVYKLNPSFAITLEAGETVGLKCPFCDHSVAKSPKLWFKKRLHGFDTNDPFFHQVFGDMHNMEADNRIVISTDHTLIIKHFRSEDAGIYMCIDSNLYLLLKNLISKNGPTDSTVHSNVANEHNMSTIEISQRFSHLTIIPREENHLIEMVLEFMFKINYNVFLTDRILEKDRAIIIDSNDSLEMKSKDLKTGLQFSIFWEPWGYCSICGEYKNKTLRQGIRKRLGDCKVKYLFEENSRMNFSKVLAAVDRIHYPFGWPCRFGIHEPFVTDEFERNITADSIQMKTCNANCTEEQAKKKNEEVFVFEYSPLPPFY
jgi:hypothetical protein